MNNELQPKQAQVALTAFFALFSIVGIATYGLPFFYDFMRDEFGWSRKLVTSGNAFGKIIVGPLFGFLAGWFIDRFGPRRLMLIGIVCGGAALVGLGRMSGALWLFYFCYLLNALGYVCGGPLPCQVLLSRWFEKARGRAMGFAYLGIGIGGALVPLIAYALNQRYGWRTSLQLLGVLMIAIAAPLAWFVKDAPDGWHAQRMDAPPVSLKSILSGWPFYLLAIGSICSIGAVGGTNQHLKLFLSQDQGYTQGAAARVASLVLASSILGRLLMGWLADRYPKKYVMILIYALVAAGIPLLFFIQTPGLIYLFAIVFGIGLGGDYMIIPLMAAELFGVRVLGRVLGIIVTTDGVAEAITPMLVGSLRDGSRSYASSFIFLIALAVIGAIAIALLPKRQREKGAQQANEANYAKA